MMNGNDCILYWNDEPIACLTSNGLSEAVTFINTAKRTQSGALKSIPLANSYQINFEAVMVSDLGMSWEDLSILMRAQVIGGWEMTGVNDAGTGFLSNLEMVSNSGEIITFTGTIVGFGEIIPADVDQNVWYQDVDVYVDNGVYVFVN
ncbi:MAG: hypothetical protein WC380_00305 [Pedobacter sp.]|jgi:hypothetical protein